MGGPSTFVLPPRVIEFLGYNPLPSPDETIAKLAWYKHVNGLSLEKLGAEMGRYPEQLADWLGGRHQPIRRNREDIERFLGINLSRQRLCEG
jgi:hypothetical protein